MKIGDIVKPKSDRYGLHSGCGSYDCAVVVRLEPFALTSIDADMLWSCTVKAENFVVCGEAIKDMLDKGLKRLK